MLQLDLKKRIQSKLLRWFEKNKRDLPWRKTRDPYAIWISEIMLQQTQVATVIPYYKTFLKTFPTISDLARADLSKVLKVWEGLGYYSRARNLHRASQMILNHFHGKIPDTLKDLLSLPGIGRSTAGAILSFAFNKDAPILDGNTKRILSRLFAVSNIDAPNSLSLRGPRTLCGGRSNPRKNEIAAPFGFATTCKDDKSLCIGKPLKGKADDILWQISGSLIPKGFSNPFNQALMDLGSMICTPNDPSCPECPLHSLCKGRRSGEPERFPLKTPKKKIPHIEGVCAVIWKKRRVLLNQRPPSGLLGGLWEFPNWKTESKSRTGLRDRIKKETGMDVEVKGFIGTFKQTFSHFKLTLHVYHCQPMDGKGKGEWVSVKNLSLFPMPRIHRRLAEILEAQF